jgi:hypothetical protein
MSHYLAIVALKPDDIIFQSWDRFPEIANGNAPDTLMGLARRAEQGGQ